MDVDIIRTVAIFAVILLHAASDLTSQATIVQLGTQEISRWVAVDIYQSIGRAGVPLFVMLTGVLLLTPEKEKENQKVFFKKRWSRVGLPFVFWALIYFIWDFTANQQAVTGNFIIQGILSGPYYHFWYIYMLAGLYLLTPLLRVAVAHAKRSVMAFFLAVWFVGTALLPVLALLTPYRVDINLFVIPIFVGYFLLGPYLSDLRVKRVYFALLLPLGIALTTVFTYVLAATIGGATMFYFQDYSSGTMILTAVSLFLLLTSFPSSKTKDGNISKSLGRKLLHQISECTLGIYFLHLIVIEALQRGYLGIAINGNTINSIIGVPLMTVLTLLICLAVVAPLKHVPVIKKLIG